MTSMLPGAVPDPDPADPTDRADAPPAAAPAASTPEARRPRALPAASVSEFDGVRYLHLGRTPWVQGAMRLRKVRKLELEYVQRMMAWLLLREVDGWPPAPALPALRVVQLGLGAASLTRYCHEELRLPTTTVELNPQVIAACRQWFRLPPDNERLQVVQADAGAWVADPARAGSADALGVDLYDQQAAAPVLDDADFYRHCHALLAPGGTLAVNLFGRNASFGRSARRIEAAFAGAGGQVRFLAPTAEGNVVVLGIKARDWPGADTLQQRARQIEARTGLPASTWIDLIRPVPPARSRRVAAPGPAEAPRTAPPTPLP